MSLRFSNGSGSTTSDSWGGPMPTGLTDIILPENYADISNHYTRIYMNGWRNSSSSQITEYIEGYIDYSDSDVFIYHFDTGQISYITIYGAWLLVDYNTGEEFDRQEVTLNISRDILSYSSENTTADTNYSSGDQVTFTFKQDSLYYTSIINDPYQNYFVLFYLDYITADVNKWSGDISYVQQVYAVTPYGYYSMYGYPYKLTLTSNAGGSYCNVTCYRVTSTAPELLTGSSNLLAKGSSYVMPYHSQGYFSVSSSTTSRYVNYTISGASLSSNKWTQTQDVTITYNSYACTCGLNSVSSTCSTCASTSCSTSAHGCTSSQSRKCNCKTTNLAINPLS